MMTKEFYKLALLGCVSSCLIGVAQASNYSDDDDDVIFKHGGPEYRDVACGAEEFLVKYKVKNLDDDDVKIDDVEIITCDVDTNDSYGCVCEDNDGDAGDEGCDTASNVDITIVTDIDDKHACGINDFTLEEYESCNLYLEINPGDSQSCSPDSSTPLNVVLGHVDRTLVLTLFGVEQEELFGNISFNETLIGSTDTAALMGDNICTDRDDSDHCPTDYTVGTLAGYLSVSQDIFVTGEEWQGDGFLSDDVHYYNDAEAYFDNYLTENGENDLQAAINNLTFAASQSECTSLADDYFNTGTTVTVTPGCYNFTGDPAVVLDATIDYHNDGTYNGVSAVSTDLLSGPNTFIFLVSFPDNDGVNVFIASEDTNYTLTSDNTCGIGGTDACDVADANNIAWVINGKSEIESGATLVGSYLLTDDLEVEFGETSQALFVGRLLALDANLAMQGNTILAP